MKRSLLAVTALLAVGCGYNSSSELGAEAQDATTENVRNIEGQWNTALLRTFDVKDTFKFLDSDESVVKYFAWDRCEDGGIAAGAHPTYRGGSDEAYQIAEKILKTLNDDKTAGAPTVTLDDIKIDCK
ncbi:hypothetical protein N9D31_03310 [Oligoflexaceae bacterium]|nr:hypothetical protein [Oligoflexaceae bacterium]